MCISTNFYEFQSFILKTVEKIIIYENMFRKIVILRLSFNEYTRCKALNYSEVCY
jgi:hypothetical protein